ncbi:MAG: rod shape-determining protein RodA [Coriobacteriia bacterium]|nr:rod shape-determining protein RodA [Coriobacteriia bacterium]
MAESANVRRRSHLEVPTLRQKKPLAVRLLKAMNLPLLFVLALLVGYGLVVLYSAVYGRTDYSFSRQAIGVLVGVAALALVAAFDYQKAANWVLPLLIVSVALNLLPLVPGIGQTVNGARSWIVLFGQQIQPSEFSKVTIIMLMAALVNANQGRLKELRHYLKCLGIMLIPVVTIFLQPDMGTGMVFFVIGLVILFVGGASRRYLIITLLVLAALIVLAFNIDPLLDKAFGHDVFLKQYQKDRLLVFINPSLDPQGLGYNLEQAKIAISTGGFAGKGFLQGTQYSQGFLPEAPTDFIFCVLAEQFGFLGSALLLLLYGLLLALALRVAMKADALGGLIVAGAMGMWVFQIVENIGMTLGMMPITGIPLPFVSYGSSFMIVNFMVVGLIISVHAHKPEKDAHRLGYLPK